MLKKWFRKSASYTKYFGICCRFWKYDNLYILQTDYDESILRNYNFKRYNDIDLMDKMYINISLNEIKCAYQVHTFCIYKHGKYEVENIVRDIAFLYPTLETKQKLGLYYKDDRRLEIDYNEFIKDVEDIWEERTSIDGFVFDVEPVYHINKEKLI